MEKKFIKKNGELGPLLAAVIALLFSAAGECPAQSLAFEDKARYEKSLEQKADDVLVRLLGPNQAKVVVDTTMDFNRTEKLEVSSELQQDKNNPFRWQGAGGDAQSGDYLMPGFPAYGAGATENKSYNRQTIFPSAFVKRMTVSIIVNRDLSETDSANVRRVVSEMLMLDAKRGDQLSVIKAPFAPLWRTIWYTPEALSLVMKYVMVGLMGIIGMIVVAVGFLKMAGAMSTMAKVQQNHQITMDLGKGAAPGVTEGGVPALGAPAEKGRAAPAEKNVQEADGAVVFNVRPDQVPYLVNMMSGEDPANVALVAGHLPEGVRADFLKQLPASFASDVLINMAKIRFIEPEVIATLKDELERRLGGAVGGLAGALEAIEKVGLRSRVGMLNELGRKEPELAAEVRRRVLLPEDIGRFSEKELSILAGALKAEEWGMALFELPQEVRDRLRAQMAERTWQLIEQSMSYGSPSREKTDEALERVMAAAGALIKEGKIMNPSVAPQPMLESGAAGA